MVILPNGMSEYNAFGCDKAVDVSIFDASKPALTVLLLNLMPEKQATERCIINMLHSYKQPVRIIPMKISGQTYKTTPNEYMNRFYTDFEKLCHADYDGMIVTGAPLEQISFEEVRYWEKLCHIMNWATLHTRSTLYICWAAQAALYHQYGIQKFPLEEKKFGVYPYEIKEQDKLLSCCHNPMMMPASRHTEVRLEDVAKCKALKVLAASKEAGVGIVASEEKRAVYITGHLEYPENRLDFEYHRDLTKGLRILPPENYYSKADDTNSKVAFTWRDDALGFYHGWLDCCAGTDA